MFFQTQFCQQIHGRTYFHLKHIHYFVNYRKTFIAKIYLFFKKIQNISSLGYFCLKSTCIIGHFTMNVCFQSPTITRNFRIPAFMYFTRNLFSKHLVVVLLVVFAWPWAWGRVFIIERDNVNYFFYICTHGEYITKSFEVD